MLQTNLNTRGRVTFDLSGILLQCIAEAINRLINISACLNSVRHLRPVTAELVLVWLLFTQQISE